jgi:glyoxylase-like metal-dependent hydrolase (beta-lactamase superfamily II)
MHCSVLLDGYSSFEPEAVFANPTKDLWVPLVHLRLDEHGGLPLPYQPVLIQDADHIVLVDAGAGQEMANEWEEPVGNTPVELSGRGIAAEDVQLVMITHAHPDHVGGLMKRVEDVNTPVFSNARHVVARAEWAYWHSDHLAGPSAEMGAFVRSCLDDLADADVLELLDDDAEVAHGIHAFATPGHTPGHMSVLLASGDEIALIAGDAILTEWSFEHPEWFGSGEVDPRAAATTRRALIERSADGDWLVTAYHVPQVGRVRHAGAGFTFAPEV